MKIIVLYEACNAMSESIQIVLFTSVSGITDRHVRVSAVEGMEIIHMQRIGGSITHTLMESYSPKWTGYWYWSGNYIRSWIVRSSYAPLSCAWKWRHCLSLSSCHVHQVVFPMIHIFWIVQAMTSLDVLPLLSFSCQHPPFRVSSICTSAFSTFFGVISWYVTGAESRSSCLVTEPQTNPNWIILGNKIA